MRKALVKPRPKFTPKTATNSSQVFTLPVPQSPSNLQNLRIAESLRIARVVYWGILFPVAYRRCYASSSKCGPAIIHFFFQT